MIGYNPFNTNRQFSSQTDLNYNPVAFGNNYTCNYAGQILSVKGGIEAIRNNFPLTPNTRIVIFNEDEDIFYIKQCDSTGLVTIRTFSFAEVIEKDESQKYLTIDEFNRFKEELLNGKQFIRSESATENSKSSGYRPVEVYYESSEGSAEPGWSASSSNVK